jgi:hypothetical protein
MSRLVKFIYVFIAVIFGVLIIIKTIEYFDPDFSKGFLSDKWVIFDRYKFFLYAHIIAAPIAFFAIVFLAAPGGFYMAFYAIGGTISTINFAVMAVLWFYFTLKAFLKVRAGDIHLHQQFMARSFILTNSAILIRIFSFVNNHYQIMDVTTGYILIAWLSWLPWLLIYEWRKSNTRNSGDF